MRKGDDGEKKRGKKIMMKIVATNVVASRSPDRRPTATPTARANLNPVRNFGPLAAILASKGPKWPPGYYLYFVVKIVILLKFPS